MQLNKFAIDNVTRMIFWFCKKFPMTLIENNAWKVKLKLCKTVTNSVNVAGLKQFHKQTIKSLPSHTVMLANIYCEL